MFKPSSRLWAAAAAAAFLWPLPGRAAFSEPAVEADVEVQSERATRPSAAADAWWQGFADQELNRLVALAQARTPPGTAAQRMVATRVAAACVGLRENGLRAAIAAEQAKTLRAQQARADATPTPQAAARRALLAKRLLSIEAQRAGYAAAADRHAAWLAQATGGSSDAMQASLRSDLGLAPVPEFRAASPLRVPTAAEAATRSLALLQQAERRSAASVQAARASGLELQAARQRADAGGPADPVLERYARLLAESDDAVSAKADLARAWIQFEWVTAP